MEYLYQNIMKITFRRGYNFDKSLQFGAQIYTDASSDEKFRDKERKKLETRPAWQLDRVKSKKEVSLEAQRDKKKVHFATLMDISQLKNVGLSPS